MFQSRGPDTWNNDHRIYKKFNMKTTKYNDDILCFLYLKSKQARRLAHSSSWKHSPRRQESSACPEYPFLICVTISRDLATEMLIDRAGHATTCKGFRETWQRDKFYSLRSHDNENTMLEQLATLRHSQLLDPAHYCVVAKIVESAQHCLLEA